MTLDYRSSYRYNIHSFFRCAEEGREEGEGTRAVKVAKDPKAIEQRTETVHARGDVYSL